MRIETVQRYEFLLKKETVGCMILETFRSLGDYLIYTVPTNVDLNRGVRVPGNPLGSLVPDFLKAWFPFLGTHSRDSGFLETRT